ncbi:MAG: hypothetical protein C0518_04540 [Opitutus sp.]|nr:hypothetical protein [Opitutus sp.]
MTRLDADMIHEKLSGEIIGAAMAVTHIRRLIGYLAITKLPLALLRNFKYSELQWKRVVRETHD